MSINFKTELKLSNSNTILTFDSEAQKRAYVRMLKGKGAKTAPIPAEVEAYASAQEEELPEEVLVQEVELLPEQLEALRKLGWLREKPAELVKPKLKDISLGKLSPLGRAKSMVVYDEIEFPMPNIYSAIIGNLLAQGVLGGDIAGTLNKLPSKSTDVLIQYMASVLERGAGQLEVLGAIELAYLQALDMNPGLEEALVETGDTILVYNTESDSVLGLAKDGRERIGDNLVGHVLMQLRSLLGGSIDPRIQIIRGKKVYTAEDIQPTFEGTEEGYTMQFALVQAKYFLGKPPSDQASEKKVAIYEEQLKTLAEFMVTRNWWPLPELRETVFVFSNGMNTMPKVLKQWIAFLANECGEVFSAARVHESLGIGYLQPVEKEFKASQDVKFNLLPYDPTMASSWLQLPLAEAAEWWAWYLSEQTNKLAAEDLIELFSILTMGKLGVTVEKNGTKLSLSKGSEVYTWDFRFGSISARQDRKAFKTTIVNGSGVSSKFTVLWLALKAYEGFKGINDILNKLTNLWEREANYGHKWEDGHPTRVIRDNSGAPIPWTAGYGTPMDIIPVNGKFDTELFLSLIHTPAYRHDAYIDKNGMKLLAGGGAGAAALTAISYPEVAHWAFECLDAGVNPLLVLPLVLDEVKTSRVIGQVLKGMHPALIVMMEYGIFWTANDGAKITKFLNRAQQGGSWNEVYAFLVNLLTGEIIHRSKSKMVISTSTEEPKAMATVQDEDDLVASLG